MGVSEHYFTASPAVEAEERTHRFSIRGVERTVVTASGVFSADRLDKGTQVLLDHVVQATRALLVDRGRKPRRSSVRCPIARRGVPNLRDAALC